MANVKKSYTYNATDFVLEDAGDGKLSVYLGDDYHGWLSEPNNEGAIDVFVQGVFISSLSGGTVQASVDTVCEKLIAAKTKKANVKSDIDAFLNTLPDVL